MVRDRLAELQAYQRNEQDEEATTVQIMSQKDIQLEAIQSEVASIQRDISQISSSIEQVEKLHSAILNSPQLDERANRHLEDHRAVFRRTSKQVQAQLKAMAHILNSDPRKGSALYRIRATQHSMLSKKFCNQISKYSEEQSKYKEKCTARIARQLAITGKEMTNGEVEEAIDSGKLSVFKEAISGDTLLARQSLSDIEVRHEDILKLEKSLVELSDLFNEVALLVEAQGETVNRIETHVQGAVDYVEKGAEETRQAMDYFRKANRCKRYLCFGLIGTLVLVALCFIGFNFKAISNLFK